MKLQGTRGPSLYGEAGLGSHPVPADSVPGLNTVLKWVVVQ